MTVYRFEEIAHNINDKKMPVPGDEKTYIGLEHLDTGSLQVTRWGQDVVLTGEKLVMKKGDVLFGRRNTYLRRAAIAPHDGIFSAHGMIFRPKTDVIDAEFFPFFISSDYFIDEAIKISVGSLSPTVNWGTLKKLEFDLPSMEEQKRLAKILMAAEETRQAYKKLIKQTDDLVQAKFTEMFGDINRIPGTKKLKDIVTIRDDLRAPLNDAARADMKEGVLYPYYGATGCVDHINKYKIDFKAICIAEDCGSYAAGDDSAYMINEKCWVNNHAHVLKAKDEVCIPEFLNYYFKVVDLTAYVSGTTRAKLTRGKLEEIPIVLPELSAQKQFVEFLQQAEQTKLATQQSLDALNETVRALVNRNFN